MRVVTKFKWDELETIKIYSGTRLGISEIFSPFLMATKASHIVPFYAIVPYQDTDFIKRKKRVLKLLLKNYVK